MAAIPNQLASNLPKEFIRTCSKVRLIKNNEVTLESGETIKSPIIVIATEQREAGRLINKSIQILNACTYCLYFSAMKAPINGPFLILNGEGIGPINHLAVISQVAPTYAPERSS